MKKLLIILLCILFVALCIITPYLIDILIFGNGFQSNITNEDWSGFLGGYIGSIIGGVFSLIGITATILFTKNQNQKDREMQLRPFFDIRYKQTQKTTSTDRFLGNLQLSFDTGGDESIKEFGLLFF